MSDGDTCITTTRLKSSPVVKIFRETARTIQALAEETVSNPTMDVFVRLGIRCRRRRRRPPTPRPTDALRLARKCRRRQLQHQTQSRRLAIAISLAFSLCFPRAGSGGRTASNRVQAAQGPTTGSEHVQGVQDPPQRRATRNDEDRDGGRDGCCCDAVTGLERPNRPGGRHAAKAQSKVVEIEIVPWLQETIVNMRPQVGTPFHSVRFACMGGSGRRSSYLIRVYFASARRWGLSVVMKRECLGVGESRDTLRSNVEGGLRPDARGCFGLLGRKREAAAADPDSFVINLGV